MLHRLFLTEDQAKIIVRALRCYEEAVLQPEFEKFMNEHNTDKAEQVNGMMYLADAVIESLTED